MTMQPDVTNSLIDWLNYLGGLHVSAIDMGLVRVLPVANALNITKPQATVFTVAGTNGKGSTTASISAISTQAGYKTALYQSPHIFKFNERIQINNTPIDDITLINALKKVDDVRISLNQSLSFFETTTLAAMLIFKESACDVWVLEVGLGGRLDVVNIIDADIAVITNIGIDHVDWLGDDKEKIGYEKAGILRKNIPCVFASNDMPASVWSIAHNLNCKIFVHTVDYDFDECIIHADTQNWLYSNQSITLKLTKPSLALQNVAGAITALLASKLVITQQHVSTALAELNLFGRFHQQQLASSQIKLNEYDNYECSEHKNSDNSLDKTIHLIADAVHNPDGARFLLSQLQPIWQQHLTNYENAKLHIVFSMLADKNIKDVIQLLQKIQQTQWHIAPLTVSRFASLDELSEHFRLLENDDVVVHMYDSVQKAMLIAYQNAGDNDKILVCGSFHTIADAFEVITV